MSDLTVNLTTPVKAHGKEIDTLTFREPKGEDIIACGYPLQIAEGAALPIAGCVAKYISRLAQVPPRTVKDLTIADFTASMEIVLGFFGDETPSS